jgi:hypothetical protein
MSSRKEYFDALEELTGAEGRFYRITDEDESPPVYVVLYDELPEPDHITAFSYGLSDAVHPEWKHSKPELMISLKSKDDSWALCMGEIIRNSAQDSLFSYGTVLHFREQIADESAMTSFLIFANSLLDAGQEKFTLPDRTIKLSQLYPIHEQEAEIIRRIGPEKFFFELGLDFYDVKRPPASVP